MRAAAFHTRSRLLGSAQNALLRSSPPFSALLRSSPLFTRPSPPFCLSLPSFFRYLLQTHDGQIKETHSISAGLDYPGVGPQHAQLKFTGRVDYKYTTDSQALDAQRVLSRAEGILPALEPSHAMHQVIEIAKGMSKDQIVLVNLCGRGDKDMLHVAKARGVTIDTDVLLTKEQGYAAMDAAKSKGPSGVSLVYLAVAFACGAALAMKLR